MNVLLQRIMPYLYLISQCTYSAQCYHILFFVLSNCKFSDVQFDMIQMKNATCEYIKKHLRKQMLKSKKIIMYKITRSLKNLQYINISILHLNTFSVRFQYQKYIDIYKTIWIIDGSHNNSFLLYFHTSDDHAHPPADSIILFFLFLFFVSLYFFILFHLDYCFKYIFF